MNRRGDKGHPSSFPILRQRYYFHICSVHSVKFQAKLRCIPLAHVLAVASFFPLLLPSHILYDWLIYYVIAPKGRDLCFVHCCVPNTLNIFLAHIRVQLILGRMNWVCSWVVVGTAYLSFSIKTFHMNRNNYY